jgi:hypothetical protein
VGLELIEIQEIGPMSCGSTVTPCVRAPISVVAVDTQFIDGVFLTFERFAVALNLEMLLSSN